MQTSLTWTTRAARRTGFVSVPSNLILIGLLVAIGACGRHKVAQTTVPPPPGSASPSASSNSVPATASNPARGKAEPKPGLNETAGEKEDSEIAEPTISADAKALATETGIASWYGPPYHNRRGSNGEVYNMHAMTAAHRTFPLGSIVRVTNTKNGRTALVRITDRGPFIPGRVVDLSLAAARKLDVYQPGTAPVKVELMESPVPLNAGGKWAVQIGGMPDEKAATKLADHLTRRYRTANVLRFKSPAGDWWIRVRVLDDDRQRAQELARDTETPEGAVFLVRLD